MSSSSPSLSRRTLFAGVGTAGVLAATVSVLPVGKSVGQASAPAPQVKPTRGGGYALSEHVQQYYQTARV